MEPSTVIILGIAACVSILALVVFRARPSLCFGVWCAVYFFVPIWVGASAGIYVSAIVAMTIMAIAAFQPQPIIRWGDVLVGGFTVLVLVLFALGLVSFAHVVAVLEYVVPFVWGRVVITRVRPERMSAWIAGCAVIAAALALVEFASGSNPFVSIPGYGPLRDAWSDLQPRGGFVRVEGALGHSIALGASLAMASAFVYSTRWRSVVKVTALTLIGTAVVLTFSRIGLVSFALTTLLTLILTRDLPPRLRAFLGIAGVVAAVAIAPLIGGVLNDAGDEAAGSADYRTSLLALLPQTNLVGAAQGWQTLVSGDSYLGVFSRSIDNTIILMLLRYGAIPVALLLIGVAGLAITVLVRRAVNPAAIAFVAQIPAFVTVALITQYGAFVWFMAGLAIGWSQKQHWADRPAHALVTPAIVPSPSRQ